MANKENKQKMSAEENLEEDEACNYIMAHLPANFKDTVSAEIVSYVLDLEDEFFESKGFYNENAPETVDFDEDDEFNFICDKIEEDNRSKEITGPMVDVILDKNYEYCDEAGIFLDDDNA